jgi:mRNA-degrading endonuclease RelE of RelBE toxin-antitoxin system
MKWRLVITPQVQSALRTFPPQTERYIRAALDQLVEGPEIGKPLRDELNGLHSFLTRRFRIIYEIQPSHRIVSVVGVGSKVGR